MAFQIIDTDGSVWECGDIISIDLPDDGFYPMHDEYESMIDHIEMDGQGKTLSQIMNAIDKGGMHVR